ILLLCCCSAQMAQVLAGTPPVIEHIYPSGPGEPAPGPKMGLSTIAMNFENIVGASQGLQQILQLIIYTADGSGPAWRTSAQTNTGGNWLSVSPPYGVDDTNIMVAVSPAGLPKGMYTG